MSVEVILIPLAIAAIASWQASRSDPSTDGRIVCHVSTRMRDGDLLAEALTNTGATVSKEGDVLSASWLGVDAKFSRDQDGIWSTAMVGDIDEARATEIVQAIDVAYGRLVQREVLARVRSQAGGAGLQIESEQQLADDSVQLVLRVGST